MPFSRALFSNCKSGSALHKTKKQGHGFEKFQVRMSVQRFFTSIFLQSKISNCGCADSFVSKAGIDSRFGKHVPFRPVCFLRNESNSSFCSIFRPTIFREVLGIEFLSAGFGIFFGIRKITLGLACFFITKLGRYTHLFLALPVKS